MTSSEGEPGTGPTASEREPHPALQRVGEPDVQGAVELLLEEAVEDPEVRPVAAGRSLRERCVVVTGGATGIGRAVALEFARHGAHIAFNYFDHDGQGDLAAEADETFREIKHLEVPVYREECDVRDPGAVRGFVARAEEALGGLHVLVNNAGIAHDRALWRLTDEQWRSVVDTNLTGAFNMIRAVAPRLREQSFGKIVNVASVHAIRSEFGLANYSASKAGLISLTRSAAVELGPSNVNVNAVAPGYIRTTRLTAAVSAEVLDRARERAVLGRLGDPQDVANVVVFLCSELARHVTGAVVPIDGGHLL